MSSTNNRDFAFIFFKQRRLTREVKRLHKNIDDCLFKISSISSKQLLLH